MVVAEVNMKKVSRRIYDGCGGNCPFKNTECFKCGKIGHKKNQTVIQNLKKTFQEKKNMQASYQGQEIRTSLKGNL